MHTSPPLFAATLHTCIRLPLFAATLHTCMCLPLFAATAARRGRAVRGVADGPLPGTGLRVVFALPAADRHAGGRAGRHGARGGGGAGGRHGQRAEVIKFLGGREEGWGC